MTEITRIAIDTSKSVFTLHGVDLAGRAVLRRNLRRRDLLPFFERLAPVEVALEACGGSHHWGRALAALGHRVRLLPPQGACPRAGPPAGPVDQAVCQARQKRPQ
jgi:transposase